MMNDSNSKERMSTNANWHLVWKAIIFLSDDRKLILSGKCK